MAHPAQRQFCESVKRRFPTRFSHCRVLDVGSLDINGSNRGLFDDCEYIGLDLAPGRNVDVVSTAHEFAAPDGSFDVVLSTEALEHDRHYAQTLERMLRLVRPDGLLFFTCATTGRAEHGTRRAAASDSPFTSVLDEWADYYRNLTEDDIRRVFDPDRHFDQYEFSVETSHCDLRFWGIVKSPSSPRRPDHRALESGRNEPTSARAAPLVQIATHEDSAHKSHDAAAARHDEKHERLPMIVPMIPYCPNAEGKNLGFAYNALMERLDDDDWACFIDHDACFTTPDWYRRLERIVEGLTRPCVLTAVTNRIGSPWQRVDGVDADNHSIRDHRRIGAALAQEWDQRLTDATDFGLMSGVVILLSKRTWRLLGGFDDGFYGVDNQLHLRARERGARVYRMDGVYVYHWYRGEDSDITAESRRPSFAGHRPAALLPPAQAPTTMTTTITGHSSTGTSEAAQVDTDDLLLDALPADAERVLYLGRPDDRLARQLKARIGREPLVWYPNKDLADPPFDASHQFDGIVLADWLQQVRDPLELLRSLRPRLSAEGRLVARVANLRHRNVLSALLAGNWRATPSNCATGNVYFTRRELEKLFYRAGFVDAIIELVGNRESRDRRSRDGAEPRAIDGLQISGLSPDEHEEFYARELMVSAQPSVRSSHGLTSIVLVTHNELAYTRQCINSLLQFTDPPYEVICVDNGSTDGTVQYLHQLDGVHLVENSENRGFPAAANQGILASRGEHVLLLNNDTLVTTGWLDRLLAALSADDRVGIVGPCSNNVSGPQHMAPGYAELASLDGFAWQGGCAHDGEIEEVDRLVGFCLLFRRSLVDEIGLLDEQFGIGNFEDDDFSLRAIEAGYRLLIARDAYVHHFGHRTFQGAAVDYAALLRENEQKFAAKWESRHPPRRRSPSGAPANATTQIPPTVEQSPAQAAIETCNAVGDGPPLAPRDVRLSLVMIVRDNEPTIESCLASIAPWVDELVVVDTGSTDRTPEIARAYGARVFHFSWCDDFSAARNESLRHATGEWLFWMDSDDTISADCGRRLRELVDGPHEPHVLGYVMQVHCPGPGKTGEPEVTVVDHVKVIRNSPELRFENRIHEQILPAIRRAGGDVAWTDIFVVHAGSDQSDAGRRRKQLRDLRLLELEDHDRPNHPFTLFNLGMTYVDMEEPARAAGYLERSIALASPEESHLRKAYAMLVGCYTACDRFDDADRTCRTALEHFTDDPELLFRHGILAHHFGHLDEAEQAYQQILDHPPGRHFSSLDRGILGYKTRHNLALAYLDADRLADAERQWRLALDEVPGYRAGWRGLADVLLRLDKLDELDRIAERLQRDPSLRAEGVLIECRAARRRRNDAQARALLEAAIAEFPADADLLRALCHLLFEIDDLDAAERRQRELVALVPDDASALQNLGMIYLRQGRSAEAVESLHASLSLRPDSPTARDLLTSALESQSTLKPEVLARHAIPACQPPSVCGTGDAAATPSVASITP